MPSISLPLLEIKPHFAAVAVPEEFDQDRGTDSSPFPDLWERFWHPCPGEPGPASLGNKGVYCCFLPDSVDFIFCKWRRRQKAKLMTLGNFIKST